MGKMDTGFSAWARTLFGSQPVKSSPVRIEKPRRRATQMLAMALEPRYMFDGAAAVTIDHAMADASHPADHPATAAPDALAAALASYTPPAAAHAAPDAESRALIPVATAPTEVRAADSALDNGKKEVAFVDSSAPGYQTLVDGIRAGVEVEVIDGG